MMMIVAECRNSRARTACAGHVNSRTPKAQSGIVGETGGKTYVLGKQGSSVCERGYYTTSNFDERITKSQCLAAAKVAYQQSSGTLNEGSWNHLPPGCSVQVSNKRPHFNTLYFGENSQTNKGGYWPVCIADKPLDRPTATARYTGTPPPPIATPPMRLTPTKRTPTRLQLAIETGVAPHCQRTAIAAAAAAWQGLQRLLHVSFVAMSALLGRRAEPGSGRDHRVGAKRLQPRWHLDHVRARTFVQILARALRVRRAARCEGVLGGRVHWARPRDVHRSAHSVRERRRGRKLRRGRLDAPVLDAVRHADAEPGGSTGGTHGSGSRAVYRVR